MELARPQPWHHLATSRLCPALRALAQGPILRPIVSRAIEVYVRPSVHKMYQEIEGRGCSSTGKALVGGCFMKYDALAPVNSWAFPQGNRVLKLAHKESGTWRSIRTVRALSAVILSPPTVTPAKAGVQGWAVGGAIPLPIVCPQIRRDCPGPSPP